MFVSVFDLFKIGIGPSSSHTIGPLRACRDFAQTVAKLSPAPARVSVTLHGALAFTGKGHATDRACLLGLCGMYARDYVPEDAARKLEMLGEAKRLPGTEIAFDPEHDIIFDFGPQLEGHTNGLVCRAFDQAGQECLATTYYSVGGGFVLTAQELADRADPDGAVTEDIPYPFKTAAEMLDMAHQSGLSIAALKMANERVFHNLDDIKARLAQIWATMDACMARGLATDGELPGGLAVKRRAKKIRDRLLDAQTSNDVPPHVVNDWIAVFAMAVNEENAAGGQVVTAPTNGAAGVLPATLRYWLDFVPGAQEKDVPIFLLTAAAIAGLIKHNASISGAECGCQAEVGSASAMAAAGLCAVMGGSAAQVENAAEIALEHHLGMTCDPVAGLVQVPCIERNGVGAIKAVAAASLALHGDGSHLVPLDSAIDTMRQTGRDMHHKYKETSLGGLAVNVPNC